MNSPFFILGFGRSGTTLLASMLSVSPNIYVPPELKNLYSFYKKHKYFGDLNCAFNLKLLLNELRYLHELRTLDIKLDEGVFVEKLGNKKISGKSIIQCFYETLLESSGKRRLGDKTIRHTLHLDLINWIFPDAKVIHMVRDGRDCALSHRRISSDYNVYLSAKRWEQFNRILLNFGKRNPKRYLRVRYEKLITEPKETLKEVCGFLEEPYSDALLGFSQGSYATKHVKLMSKHHANLGKGIMKANFGKWRSGLSSNEIKIFESVAESMLRSLDYNPRGDFPGINWRLTKLHYVLSRGVDTCKYKLLSAYFIGVILLKRLFKVYRLRDLSLVRRKV